MSHHVVDANPTKEFFISMLTRDISLNRSILDLIDNSVDSAVASGSVKGKKIEVNFNSEYFEIKDNCGGMTIDTATKYAFRFGRDNNDERLTPHSVGQFGVGMKRTLFKLGNKFSVKSEHKNSAFSINVDVKEWLDETNSSWEFSLNEEQYDTSIEDGVIIRVDEIFPPLQEQFSDNDFLRDFKKEVEKAYFKRINEGLEIIINGSKVNEFSLSIRISDELGGVYKEEFFDGVKISIRCGVDEQSYEKGGWYIVCNGRLVEAAEQTNKTLWGTNSIPKYHDRLAFFRGIVEFESENSSKLPWTTTKTGVDTDNTIYRYANKLMIDALTPILTFLNQREAERKQANDNRLEDDERVLENSIKNAKLSNIYHALNVPTEDFIRPEKIEAKAAQYTTITFQYDTEKVDKAKENSGARSASEAGKIAFDYYYSYECE